MLKNEISPHAKTEKSHCLVPGLFRSLKKGDKKKYKLDVVRDFGNGRKIEFSGPDILGADDLRVLQGLLAIATSKDGFRVPKLTNSIQEQHLRSLMELKWDAKENDVLVIRTSYRALAAEIGYADIENTLRIQKSVERLWKVSIIAQVNGKRFGFRLLSHYASDLIDNLTESNIQIALNPLILSAILGKQPYAYIDMNEVRNLKTDVARIIHYRLCGWIDRGKTRPIGMEALCEYAWPEDKPDKKPINRKTKWKRQQSVRSALKQLESMEWKVEEIQENQFNITRPE